MHLVFAFHSSMLGAFGSFLGENAGAIIIYSLVVLSCFFLAGKVIAPFWRTQRAFTSIPGRHPGVFLSWFLPGLGCRLAATKPSRGIGINKADARLEQA